MMMQGMTEARVSERRRSLAAWLREGLIKLGPTFIKIGQQFSTRVDVLSPEFVKELEMLQDNVPAFSSAAAVATVERGLGKPITEVFEECVPFPVCSRRGPWCTRNALLPINIFGLLGKQSLCIYMAEMKSNDISIHVLLVQLDAEMLAACCCLWQQGPPVMDMNEDCC